MLPALRLVIYCGFGAILWMMAAAVPAFVTVALLYNLVLLLVAVLDLWLSPQPKEFEIERVVDAKMNLGAPNVVNLRARWRGEHSERHTSMLIRDETPADWPIEAVSSSQIARERAPLDGVKLPPIARVSVEVRAGREAEASYRVTPTRRGDFAFGHLHARYRTALGLWHRQFRREAPLTVRVYPDTSEVRRYELRLRQGRLQDMGLHLLRLRGQGTEYESLRDYTTDDEYKAINWKASARRGKLIATNFEIERDQTIIIALDCGRMMTALAVSRESKVKSPMSGAAVGFQSTLEHASPASEVEQSTLDTVSVALSKLDCAINATVLLAHVAASMGDAVGLLLFTDTVKTFVPPRKGKVQTGTIIEALYAAQPQLVEPDYSGAYQHLMVRKLRRSLVVTFTDLIDPFASRELIQASAALRRHHNALCVTINNRDVMDLAAQMPQGMNELYEKAMAQRMLSQRAQALETLRQNGVGVLDVEASQLTVASVNRYLDLKARAAL
jgi:uncharacterized protein (DUF58 family)